MWCSSKANRQSGSGHFFWSSSHNTSRDWISWRGIKPTDSSCQCGWWARRCEQNCDTYCEPRSEVKMLMELLPCGSNMGIDLSYIWKNKSSSRGGSFSYRLWRSSRQRERLYSVGSPTMQISCEVLLIAKFGWGTGLRGRWWERKTRKGPGRRAGSLSTRCG